jgi:hypothetical protein
VRQRGRRSRSWRASVQWLAHCATRQLSFRRDLNGVMEPGPANRAARSGLTTFRPFSTSQRWDLETPSWAANSLCVISSPRRIASMSAQIVIRPPTRSSMNGRASTLSRDARRVRLVVMLWGLVDGQWFVVIAGCLPHLLKPGDRHVRGPGAGLDRDIMPSQFSGLSLGQSDLAVIITATSSESRRSSKGLGASPELAPQRIDTRQEPARRPAPMHLTRCAVQPMALVNNPG